MGAVIRRAGPRLVRDAVGPLALFSVGWKSIDLTAGIVAAALFGVAVFMYERRQDRPATVVCLALLLVAIRASVGLSSGSATVYLAQEIAIDTLLGSAALVSLATGHPFSSWFASEIFPLPQQVRESEAFDATARSPSQSPFEIDSHLRPLFVGADDVGIVTALSFAATPGRQGFESRRMKGVMSRDMCLT